MKIHIKVRGVIFTVLDIQPEEGRISHTSVTSGSAGYCPETADGYRQQCCQIVCLKKII